MNKFVIVNRYIKKRKILRNLHNIDIKTEANSYAIETHRVIDEINIDSYLDSRQGFIDGFFFAVEKIEQEYTETDVQLPNGVTVKALVKKKDLQ